jgi:hypothetical protein
MVYRTGGQRVFEKIKKKYYEKSGIVNSISLAGCCVMGAEQLCTAGRVLVFGC